MEFLSKNARRLIDHQDATALCDLASVGVQVREDAPVYRKESWECARYIRSIICWDSTLRVRTLTTRSGYGNSRS